MNVRHWVRLMLGVLLGAGLVVCGLSCQRKSEQQTGTATPDTTQPRFPERGKEAYLADCAMCHGESGEGDGPLAEELKKLAGVAPAHLNDRALLAQLGRHGLVQVITRGGAHTGRSNLMPPWGERLSASLIRDIADFVLVLPDLAPGVPRSTIEHYLQAPPGVPAEGRKLFLFYCTACHGPQGKGNGIYADTVWARSHIRPRDLTDSVYLSRKTDQDLYTIISLGGGHMGKSVYMPAWTVTLKPGQIKDVLSYVRVISRTAPKP